MHDIYVYWNTCRKQLWSILWEHLQDLRDRQTLLTLNQLHTAASPASWDWLPWSNLQGMQCYKTSNTCPKILTKTHCTTHVSLMDLSLSLCFQRSWCPVNSWGNWFSSPAEHSTQGGWLNREADLTESKNLRTQLSTCPITPPRVCLQGFILVW